MNLDPRFFFSPKGPLRKKLAYFEFRPSQIDYAQAVDRALSENRIALLEAQTGTGKTLAYLVPAIKAHRRVIVSTGTKALQEQLYHKDIPLLRDKLGLPFEYVLMKGRQNYLCRLKYERAQIEPVLPDEESVDYFREIQEWVEETETGDIAESGIPEHEELWKQLTISSEACLGNKCRFYNQCFVFKLKERAEKAQILIVNHHLFFSDLSLQRVTGTSIFPPYDIVIFDEAHQLAEIATHNLNVVFSERNFRELIQEVLKELQMMRIRLEMNTDSASQKARKLGETVISLFHKFITLPQRLRYTHAAISRIVEGHGTVIDQMFMSLLEELFRLLDKTEDMPQLYRRVAMQQSSLAFLLQASDEAYVYWAERQETGDWSLQASPLDVSQLLKASLWPNLKGAVLTSATLFIDQKCEPVKEALGIDECFEESFPYNFNYEEQACLYIPQKMPDPAHPSFADAAAEQIAKLVTITDGGAFVLCTSYANMRKYQSVLNQMEYPLLVQGSRSKQELIRRFLKTRGSVLLATMSFWQGIDIQGDALVSVIVDKLPFAVPNDPLTEAKIQYLRKLGKNAFIEYQLPLAVMLLKQGLGRLIRTSVDYGLLAVLDRRLYTKDYGRVFLRNLPAMPIIQDLAELRRAFGERRQKFLPHHL